MIRMIAASMTISTIAALLPNVATASQCIQLAADAPRIWRAALAPDQVNIKFIGHSAFRIETGEGRAAVTDFYGDTGTGPMPDAVTMNNAHSSHWTAFPPEEIKHPLQGWAEEGTAAEHWLHLDDLLIRNVPTDTRDWGGDWHKDGNSIFVFEYQDLCIGHLGHLHHKPTEEDYAMIGRLDIVLAPVDGGYTMAIADMIEVLKRVRARVVIPMHIFRSGSFERFLAGMADDFEIEFVDGAELTYSAQTLPSVPTIKVLRPAVSDGGFGLED